MSTVGKLKPPFLETDSTLVKIDLMNQFFTRKGERVMLPNFGCVIWDYMMDPMDDLTRSVVEEDVRRIISEEPRVNLVDLFVTDQEHLILVEVVLFYITDNIVDRMILEFDRNAQ